MLKNEDIVCISSIDWDFLWQGHQEIMTRLARNGNRVLFIENTGARSPMIRDFGRIRRRVANWRRGLHGIRKLEDGLYVYSPIVLPFPYLKMARFINKRLMFSVLFKWLRTVGFSKPIVWAFLPTGLSLDLINKIDPKVLVYYCIDFFQASSKDASKIKASEKLLIKKADLVFVTSEQLFKHCAQYSNNVHYFPFGVNIENFKEILKKTDTTPDDIKNINRPIAGYIGGIHKWIDFELVRYVASTCRDISFVFCGMIQENVSMLSDQPNIIFLGQKRAEDLPAYVKEFDVALIPYVLAEYTKCVYPTKLNEYLSLGKTVVSTDLPEVRKFNKENNDIVRISGSMEDFAANVRLAIDHPYGEKEVAIAVEAAEKNSWSNKVEKMSILIESAEREKARQREVSWQRNLSQLYRRTKNNLVPVLVLLGLIYLVLFRTSFIWFIAGPLHIADMPQKADVIVALGGGVGESGRVGQGYQERVETAVKLHNQHFADRILYSSGYKYLMKEASVMKTLSTGMGVDEKDIMLDDVSANTYEMIFHLKNLAEKNGWSRIILVSSPYHMLRLKFLCDKYIGALKVFYVPVGESEYYAKGSRVTLKQIEGVFQEYLAIAYYRFKNYI